MGSRAMGEIRVFGVPVMGEIRPGDSLSERLIAAASATGIRFQHKDTKNTKKKNNEYLLFNIFVNIVPLC